MRNRDYQASDILTFVNGNVGCITNNFRLAIVAPNGAPTCPTSMPLLADYLDNHDLVRWEDKHYNEVWSSVHGYNLNHADLNDEVAVA